MIKMYKSEQDNWFPQSISSAAPVALQHNNFKGLYIHTHAHKKKLHDVVRPDSVSFSTDNSPEQRPIVWPREHDHAYDTTGGINVSTYQVAVDHDTAHKLWNYVQQYVDVQNKKSD